MVNVRLAMDHVVSFLFLVLILCLVLSTSYTFSNFDIFYLQVNLPKGFAYVEFKIRADAEKAQLHMDGV